MLHRFDPQPDEAEKVAELARIFARGLLRLWKLRKSLSSALDVAPNTALSVTDRVNNVSNGEKE